MTCALLTVTDRPLTGIALTRSPSLPAPRVFGLDTRVLWTGANLAHYAATSGFSSTTPLSATAASLCSNSTDKLQIEVMEFA